ncbi:MAG: InlB B-repeat-containing protein [Treponema sp.]|jgi:hypothetical protein|nr:InlB B-repeat-containing protein [Treponema sp.]
MKKKRRLPLFTDILFMLGILGCRLEYVPTMVYTISYDPNGGSGTVPIDTTPYKQGDAATVLEPKRLIKETFVFAGWNTKPDGSGSSYLPGSLITVDAELILYACWITPPDTRTFYAQRLTDGEWYELNADLLAEGEHCMIYGDRKEGIPIPTAEAIIEEYESVIYPAMTDTFGAIEDIDENGKVIFLLLDIIDGYKGSGSYIMGYFQPADMYRYGDYSNQADMLYLDIDPLGPGSREFYASLAHELEHLINFSNTAAKDGRSQDIWIDEGLATAAEYIYGGDPNHRIPYYNADPYHSIVYGNNFFVWNGYWEDPLSENVSYDPAANYATVYLFFQWLRIHSRIGTGIYKEIINSPYRDYRAVTEAAARWIDPCFAEWETLLRSGMLANVCNAAEGFWGYKGEIKTVCHYFQSTGGDLWQRFSPGEGIVSAFGESPFSPNNDSGPHIRYVGLSRTGELSETPPYTGDYLLTFNANSDAGASGYEQGYLAGTGTAFLPRDSGIPDQFLPNRYPIDVRFNRDGSFSFSSSGAK